MRDPARANPAASPSARPPGPERDHDDLRLRKLAAGDLVDELRRGIGIPESPLERGAPHRHTERAACDAVGDEGGGVHEGPRRPDPGAGGDGAEVLGDVRRARLRHEDGVDPDAEVPSVDRGCEDMVAPRPPRRHDPPRAARPHDIEHPLELAHLVPPVASAREVVPLHPRVASPPQSVREPLDRRGVDPDSHRPPTLAFATPVEEAVGIDVP